MTIGIGSYAENEFPPTIGHDPTEFLDDTGVVPAKHAPLLWMHHVHPMRVTWPNGTRKPEYIKNVATTRKLLLLNRNYVLLRRFSAKEERRRLIAAPYLAKDFDSPLAVVKEVRTLVATGDEGFQRTLQTIRYLKAKHEGADRKKAA